MKKFLALFAFLASPAWAQTVPQAPAPVALACAYNSAVPSPTSGQFFYVQCDSTGRLITNNSITINTTAISGGTSGKILYDNAATVGEANLWIESANQVALRNGTSAQSQLIYRTYTDGSNYERMFVGADHAGTGITGFGLFVEKAGTGSDRSFYIGTTGTGSLSFVTNNNSRWTINSSGALLANTDNSYSIGASNASRPQHIYAGSNVYASTFAITRGATTYANFLDNGDGIIRLLNGAGTSFTRPQWGGTTANFPALYTVNPGTAGNGFRILTADLSTGVFLEGLEQTAPAAAPTNGYRIFAQDNGAGKTQLMVIFSSGAAQQLAIQP